MNQVTEGEKLAWRDVQNDETVLKCWKTGQVYWHGNGWDQMIEIQAKIAIKAVIITAQVQTTEIELSKHTLTSQQLKELELQMTLKHLEKQEQVQILIMTQSHQGDFILQKLLIVEQNSELWQDH